MKKYEKPAIMMMAIECEVMQVSGPNAGDVDSPNGPNGPNGGGPGANDVGDPDGSRNPSFSVWDE